MAEQTRIYRGLAVSSGPPALVVDHGKTYAGTHPAGPVLFSVDDDHVYLGETTLGAPLATVEGEHVYAGKTTSGAPIAQLEGDIVRALSNGQPGEVMATLSQPDRAAGAVAAIVYDTVLKA